MRRLISKLGDLIWGENPNCIICKEDAVNTYHGVCESCLKTFPFADAPLIGKCHSVCRYEPPVKQLIYDYKYNDQRYLGKSMALMMADLIRLKNLDIDLILTVPCSEKRRAVRGFDHMFYVAKKLAEELNLTYGEGILLRSRDTERLKGLSKSERLAELDQVFSVDLDASLRGKKILIIDDILTTGATLSACTEVLLAYEPDSVCWMTFAMVI